MENMSYMMRGYGGIIVTMPQLVEGVCFSGNIYMCLVKTHVLLQIFPKPMETTEQ